MATIFANLLVILTLITGLVWALDKWKWSKQRAAAVDAAQQQGVSDEATIAKLSRQPSWVENCTSTFPVIAAVMILRSFIYEPFQIPSGSMMPTLLVGDFILVEKFSYGLKDPVFRKELVATGKPERGDIAVFKYPVNPRIDYIKRVAGMPGDRIAYRNKQLYVIPACETDNCVKSYQPIEMSDQQISEFVQSGTPLLQFNEQLGEVEHQVLVNPRIPDMSQYFYPQPGMARSNEWVVPEGHYFMVGDNRDNSQDSRFWGFVAEELMVGKAVAIWISFEFEREDSSILPGWVPTGVRFNRVGGIH